MAQQAQLERRGEACDLVVVRAVCASGALLVAIVIDPLGSPTVSLAAGAIGGIALAIGVAITHKRADTGRQVVLGAVGVLAGWLPIVVAAIASR